MPEPEVQADAPLEDLGLDFGCRGCKKNEYIVNNVKFEKTP